MRVDGFGDLTQPKISMTASNRSSPHPVPHESDYEWEYYDEPVSFEGLKAHRYSIVIGFWVGLAVFVLFMFFVLTLLTKTGAPHPENAETWEKRVRLISCGDDVAGPPEHHHHGDHHQSRTLFHCYIQEDEHAANRRPSAATASVATHLTRARGGDAGCSATAIANGQAAAAACVVQDLEQQTGGALLCENENENERDAAAAALLAHFSLPNFINSELSSTLGDDDLLLGEPPLIMEDEEPPRTRGGLHSNSSSRTLE